MLDNAQLRWSTGNEVGGVFTHRQQHKEQTKTVANGAAVADSSEVLAFSNQ